MKTLCLMLWAVSLAALAAKYVDPLNGNDANDGSISAPWKTLTKIHQLNDTVYITNSAVCYFGDTGDRSPSNVLLTSWGPARPTILASNVATSRLIYLGSPGRTIRMNNVKWTRAYEFGSRIVHMQGTSANTVEVDNCEFDMTGNTNNRAFYIRTDQAFVRFCSNLVYNLVTSEFFIHSEQYPFNVDFRYNRFYNVAGGILHTRIAGCKGIVANNTALSCTLLVSTESDSSGVTNLNNIVDNFVPSGSSNNKWISYSAPTRIMFADYTYSGDPDATTFGAGIIKGPSNFVSLSDVQLAFVNNSDVASPDFLKIELESVAASSAASITYPTLNLPPWAGWAAPAGAPTNPILSVNPPALDLGAVPVAATYTIANAGIGILYWTNTVSAGGAWLALSRTTGTQSGTVTVTVDRTSLAYGSYTGRIDVTANGDIPVQYVTVYLRKSPPLLAVTPATLDAGATLTALPYALSNAGAEVLYWTNAVTAGGTWLSVAPAIGSQNGAATASVNRTSVGYGSYTGAVVVSANGAVPAATVSVFMTKSPPDLAVAPLALDFGRASTSQTVDVWNNGVGTVNWTAAPDAAWLALSASAGTASNVHQVVTVLVNRALLAPSNDFTGHVLFTPDAGPIETVTVAVSTFALATNGMGFLHIAIVPESNPSTPMPGRLILASVAAGATNYLQWFETEEEAQTNRWGYTGWFMYTTLQGVHHPRKYLTYRVPAGDLLITAGRGMSWYPTNAQVTINNGATTDVAMVLRRVVDMETRGWYCGEAHVHVNHGGGDYPINQITSNQFMLWAEAAGVNFLSLNQEYLGAGATNLAGQQAYILPMSNATCQVWMGGERPKSILGHLAEIIPPQNPFTVLDDPPYYIGCEQVRRQGGITYPVHADRQFGAVPYEWNNFYKSYPLDALLGPAFDAWSVASNNERGYNGRQLGWWYALLNRGSRLPAMADSDYAFDTIFGGMSMIGNWIAYVNISGQVFSSQNICTAIRQGRTFATTGPLVFFSIDGAQSGDTVPVGAHTVAIEAYLPFHPWSLANTTTAGTAPMRLSQIELVRNGVQVKNWTSLNVAATTLYWSINETATNAYYTVHVKGNDGDTIAAIASPIYFDDRPLHQKPLVTTIEGRVYDAYTGERKPATVAVSRYGTPLADFVTATDGFFKIQMPLDADVILRPLARDTAAGPLPSHRVMDQELVFSNITTMGRSALGGDAGNYAANALVAGGAIESMVAIVTTMRWEFPLKYQFKNSYVATNLLGEFPITSLEVLDAPATLASYTNPATAMLIVDKYEVAPGDTVNYAAIFRMEGNNAATPDRCVTRLYAWQPYAPSSYSTWGYSGYEKNSGFVNLGNGFHAFIGSIPVPAFVTNCYQGPGVIIDMYTRASSGYSHPTGLGLYLNVGTTKRGLLVTTSWPGVPFAWPNHLQTGLGPANLTQSTDGWNVPRRDYRPMRVRLNGSLVICPSNDMAVCADADDAYFYDWPYYYTKGATAKDPVRPQPDVTFPNIAALSIDPFAPGFGTQPPVISAVAPADGTLVLPSEPIPLSCAYQVVGRAVSNVRFSITAPHGTIIKDFDHDFVYDFADFSSSGIYTWTATVTAYDGSSAITPARTFHVVPEATITGALFAVGAALLSRHAHPNHE